MRPLLLVFLWVIAPPLFAQDLDPILSGRLDSSWNLMETPLADGNYTLGLVTGWAGLAAGTKDVKVELRGGVTNYPQPQVTLEKAWLKFRIPSVRFTTGLGRLGWGTGMVFIPGNLLFDSLDSQVNWGSDDLRTAGEWMGSLLYSMDEEVFLEAGVKENAVGLRFSAAPMGITIEIASVWDQAQFQSKSALSTQFHLGLDWYGTLRQDYTPGNTLETDLLMGSVGAFGLWNCWEVITLSTRHEVLLKGTDPWATLQTYHDLTLAGVEGISLTGRGLYATTGTDPWTIILEVRWAPISNLSLYTSGVILGPKSLRLGTLVKW